MTVSRVEKVGGVSAVAAAAYRAGEAIEDERLGRTYDYGSKGHVLHTEIMTPAGELPAWATHRARLWNEVEKAEKRKDAVVAREVEVMLPRELSTAEQLALVRRFAAEQFVAKGLIVDFAIHRPEASDGQPHPHCHMMITPRAITPEGFHAYKDQTFWWASKGDKSKDELEKLRARWAQMQNEALESAGSAARVDHRSLAAQREEALQQERAARAAGQTQEAARHAHRAAVLDRQPEPTLGVEGALMRQRGRMGERFLRWLRVKQDNLARSHLLNVATGSVRQTAMRTAQLVHATAYRTLQYAPHHVRRHLYDADKAAWEWLRAGQEPGLER